ncbi:MAG: hypothetical protein ABIO70_28905 [Pseudomonadota bacterium]
MPSLHAWPGLPSPLTTGSLRFSRAIYGKAHGAPTDFRWLARSPGFPTEPGIEAALGLGPLERDLDQRGVHWSALGRGSFLAQSSYPSRARDADNRPCPLERQALLWQGQLGITPALAALLMLPWCSDNPGDDLWWPKRDDPAWSDPAYVLALGAGDAPALDLDPDLLADTVTRGLRALTRRLDLAQLTSFFLHALSPDARGPLVLSGLADPLSPAAMACLLLPLTPEQARPLSMAGWLYSSRVQAAELGAHWKVVFCGEPPGGYQPPVQPSSGPLFARARACAQALIDGDPTPLLGPLPDAAASAPQPIRRRPGAMEIAMWGPASSGKTMLLAQLLLDSRYSTRDWLVYPTAEAEAFAQVMYRAIKSEHRFPLPTVKDNPQSVLYTFRHEGKDRSVDLYVEDRAGALWEKLDDESKERLIDSAGLVLLFDPTREPMAFRQEVFETLTSLFLTRKKRGIERDPRPVAVCLSKADEIMESADDVRRACSAEERGAFVASWLQRHGHQGVIDQLEKYHGCYQLFPVSSVGVLLRHGVVEPAVFYDEQLLPRIIPHGQAMNIMAPFDWIFAELEARGVFPS